MSRSAFNDDAKRRAVWRYQLFSKCPDRFGEVIRGTGGRPQVVTSTPAFCDRLIGALKALFELVFRFPVREQIADGLEAKNQPLEALQQCVVQFPSDAGPLRHSLFKTELKLAGDLA